jgi:RNA recognition motif-containing protein
MSEKVSYYRRTVFVGGIPRKGRNRDDLLVAMDNSIFSRWAHHSFHGKVSQAKLRVDARKQQSMGYGFLTFGSVEDAEAALELGRIAFDSSFVEIKPTVQKLRDQVFTTQHNLQIVTETNHPRSLAVTATENVCCLYETFRNVLDSPISHAIVKMRFALAGTR